MAETQNLSQQFIEFLIEHQALKFGTFTLKSGRQSPYFFNLGVFNSGASLLGLAKYYAKALECSSIDYDLLFGPAYKGIPLATATAMVLFQDYHKRVPYCFNRKQPKEYGDGGNLVGAPLKGQVVMLDDVITAGTTVRDTITLLEGYPASLSGIVIAFDRQERGDGDTSAVREVADRYAVTVQSIIDLSDVMHYLSKKPQYAAELAAIEAYQQQYGVA